MPRKIWGMAINMIELLPNSRRRCDAHMHFAAGCECQRLLRTDIERVAGGDFEQGVGQRERNDAIPPRKRLRQGVAARLIGNGKIGNGQLATSGYCIKDGHLGEEARIEVQQVEGMQEQDKSGESDEAPEGSEEEVAAARGSDAVDAEAAALAAGEEPAEAEHAEEGEAVIHDDQRRLKGDGWVDGVRVGMRLCLSVGVHHLLENEKDRG